MGATTSSTLSGEVPGADASVADVAAYVARADVSRYCLGRSFGLLGVCCLLVFVAHVAARTAEAEGETRTLSRVLLAVLDCQFPLIDVVVRLLAYSAVGSTSRP